MFCHLKVSLVLSSSCLCLSLAPSFFFFFANSQIRHVTLGQVCFAAVNESPCQIFSLRDILCAQQSCLQQVRQRFNKTILLKRIFQLMSELIAC